MTAVTHPIAEHLTTTHAARQGGSQSFGWLGTSCGVCLLGVLVLMHLPMLVVMGLLCAIGSALKKDWATDEPSAASLRSADNQRRGRERRRSFR